MSTERKRILGRTSLLNRTSLSYTEIFENIGAIITSNISLIYYFEIFGLFRRSRILSSAKSRVCGQSITDVRRIFMIFAALQRVGFRWMRLIVLTLAMLFVYFSIEITYFDVF